MATPLLASQLGWNDGNPFLVAGDADSFAAKCVELHTNPALWEKLRQAGLERIQRECSREAFEEYVASISRAENAVRTPTGMRM